MLKRLLNLILMCVYPGVFIATLLPMLVIWYLIKGNWDWVDKVEELREAIKEKYNINPLPFD